MSTATIKPTPVTAKEFETFEPDQRYELIEGALHSMPPPPGYEHGLLTAEFSLEAGGFVRLHNLGKCFAAETRFVIEHNPDTAIGPDWAFIAKDRLPKRTLKGFAPIAPDALLEVRSPIDRSRELEDKIECWLKAGVRLVWELDPKTRTLTVHRAGVAPRRLGIDETLSGEEVLPGFLLPLKTLFASIEDQEDQNEEEGRAEGSDELPTIEETPRKEHQA